MGSFGTPNEIKETKLIKSKHFFKKFSSKDSLNKNKNDGEDEEFGFLTFFFKYFVK